MKTVVDRAESRGHANQGWLDTSHTFSFAGYHNPDRMGFGALRVLNDDKVSPGEGFDTHPHRNMEIVSIPLKGHLIHGDSTNSRQTITVGDIQVMSAGTGIFHSERNASDQEPVEFLQIWVIPKHNNTQPQYNDYDIRKVLKNNQLSLIISPDADAPASLGQDAWFSIGKLDKGISAQYKLHRKNTGVYLFVIEGRLKIGDNELGRRDGMGVSDTGEFAVEALKESCVLLVEVPLHP